MKMPRRSPPSARRGTTSRRNSASRPRRASVDAAPKPDLSALQKRLEVTFKDKALLLQALTHSSYAHEHPDEVAGDNERLEFLGDAVIELVAAHLLFRQQPEVGEGILTLDRAAMVSTGALAAVARGLGLGDYLRVGRGVEASGGRDLDSLLANAVEALMGAIYLDRGLAAADKAFQALSSLRAEGLVNFKGRLQELSQADSQGVPSYEVVEASGPGHRRHYRVRVRLGGIPLGTGEGRTRRAAEQAAAKEALSAFAPPAADERPRPARVPRVRRPRAQDVVAGKS
ncbi:MAG TPA: ribonuclease III [Candidatus Dormibacteraeota bacterium]|jgi:ribonuclease-3|nr:ribonuclease III [Candidatus Dormibacteraeota bacterium]